MIEIDNEKLHIEGTQVILTIDLEKIITVLNVVAEIDSDRIMMAVKHALRKSDDVKRTGSL